MNRFDRQQRITGWDQERFTRACVAVLGRGWLGTFLVWALCALGVKRVMWLGRPQRVTERLARWFLADPSPFGATQVCDYPFDTEYGAELDWCFAGLPLEFLVVCTDDPGEQAACRAFAGRRGIRLLAGSAAKGGWVGKARLSESRDDGTLAEQHPIPAMAVAAMLVDAVRQVLCPLPGDLALADSELGWLMPETPPGQFATVVAGVGAIGTYLATLLAAPGIGEHLLVDFDCVEETNLNRQGLFTLADVQAGANKALAAVEALTRLFPRARLAADTRRVGPEYRSSLANISPAPVILSAVDNARTRLLLGSLGSELGLPVIQGGTSIYAADCYVQAAGGPSLDEQMFGAMTAAAEREHARERQGGCAVDPSFVAPGMVAAAMIAYRLAWTCAEARNSPGALRWRSGGLPVEQGSECDVWDFEEPVA